MPDYSPAEERHNLILNCIHEFTWGFGIAFHSTYALIPLFLARLGAPHLVIASVAGVFSILMAGPELISAGLGRNIRNYKAAVIGVHTLVWPPVFFMAFIFTVLTPTGPGAWLFYYACFVLYSLAVGFIIPIWSGFLHRVTNRRTRGSFIGISFALNSLGGFIGGWAVKIVFESSLPFPRNFGVGFWILLASVVTGTLVFLGYRVKDEDTPVHHRTLTAVWQETRNILRRHRNFRRYLISRIFLTANYPAMSLYAVYAQEKFHFALSEAGVFTVIQVVAFGLASTLAGKLGDRQGHKRSFSLAVVAYVAALIMALFAHNMLMVYGIFLFMGVGQGAFLPSSLNLVYDFAGAGDNRIYMALVDTFLAPFTALSILVVGLLVNSVPYAPLFWGIGVSLLVGLVLLLFWVRDPRHRQHPPDYSLPV
ncbi:MAG: MFS transporter [Candidatus Neomarinimicrobiota bacterium]|nr:MAG: MFS transporter [Candidatus Neomarinimicrobiota bacterium]